MTVCVAVFVDGESRAVDGCLRGRRGRSVGGDQSVLTVCVVSIDRHRFGTLVGDLLTVGNQFVAAGKLLTGPPGATRSPARIPAQYGSWRGIRLI